MEISIIVLNILEESSRVEEVEIIISDDPPNYEAPPEYADVIKTVDMNFVRKNKQDKKVVAKQTNRCFFCCLLYFILFIKETF